MRATRYRKERVSSDCNRFSSGEFWPNNPNCTRRRSCWGSCVPILTVQLNGEQQLPDGSKVPAPPELLLQVRGPVIQVTVGLAQSVAQELAARGEIVPAPVAGWAMIDTGASGTCIDEDLAQQMGLPVIDRQRIATPSHNSAEMNVYPASITITPIQHTINVDRAVGVSLDNQGIIALIGRDFLAHCTLHYNGTTGTFTIAR